MAQIDLEVQAILLLQSPRDVTGMSHDAQLFHSFYYLFLTVPR